MFIRYMTALAILAALLVGCGGGGGSTLTVSAQNAGTLANQTVLTSEFLLQMSDFSEDFADLLEDPETLAALCQGGSASVAPVDVTPVGVLSAGDSITYTFNNCSFDVLGIPFIFNGSITINVNTATGDETGPFEIELDTMMNNFTFGIGDANIRVDGGYVANVNSDGDTLVADVSGASLRAYFSAPNTATITSSWANFTHTRTLSLDDGSYTVDVDAAYYGSLIGGTITFETLTTISGGSLESYPSVGTFKITGVDGSSVTVNVLDSINVELLIDTDGDGTIDVTINTTWEELDS